MALIDTNEIESICSRVAAPWQSRRRAAAEAEARRDALFLPIREYLQAWQAAFDRSFAGLQRSMTVAEWAGNESYYHSDCTLKVEGKQMLLLRFTMSDNDKNLVVYDSNNSAEFRGDLPAEAERLKIVLAVIFERYLQMDQEAAA